MFVKDDKHLIYRKLYAQSVAFELENEIFNPNEL